MAGSSADHAPAINQDLSAKVGNDLEARMRDMLTSEGIERAPERRPTVQHAQPPVANQDGLAAARHDLEHRAREGVKMVRMVDRSRQQLEAAELELDAAHDKLARLTPVVQSAARSLRVAMEAAQRGEMTEDLSQVFDHNDATLEELEAIAGGLCAQLLWCRSAWDQYAATVTASRRLLSEPARP